MFDVSLDSEDLEDDCDKKLLEFVEPRSGGRGGAGGGPADGVLLMLCRGLFFGVILGGSCNDMSG